MYNKILFYLSRRNIFFYKKNITILVNLQIIFEVAYLLICDIISCSNTECYTDLSRNILNEKL